MKSIARMVRTCPPRVHHVPSNRSPVAAKTPIDCPHLLQASMKQLLVYFVKITTRRRCLFIFPSSSLFDTACSCQGYLCHKCPVSSQTSFRSAIGTILMFSSMQQVRLLSALAWTTSEILAETDETGNRVRIIILRMLDLRTQDPEDHG
jgi:hypothetical protein